MKEEIRTFIYEGNEYYFYQFTTTEGETLTAVDETLEGCKKQVVFMMRRVK